MNDESQLDSPQPGDLLSYAEMCAFCRARLRRGMNYQLRGGPSVFLMSQREDALYNDQLQGDILIYEGHNAPLSLSRDPDKDDQPDTLPNGNLTQNGLFAKAAHEFKSGTREAEVVRVFEKLREGSWLFHGAFQLLDAWQEHDEARLVWKFRLERETQSAN